MNTETGFGYLLPPIGDKKFSIHADGVGSWCVKDDRVVLCSPAIFAQPVFRMIQDPQVFNHGQAGGPSGLGNGLQGRTERLPWHTCRGMADQWWTSKPPCSWYWTTLLKP